ncbi:MAG TPA: hypothetical protein VGR57_21725 [Ktedonobacterales bacterium]|nr:hypothetical protein [Ktedonobacterales bacterium]
MHAISDVFCEKRRRFLVSYPTPLIIILSAFGLLAFIFVGYLGYNTRLDCGGHGMCWQLQWFAQPWPLYVWFSALMVVLQVSILRHPRLRAQLVATLVVTLVSTVLIGWLYFYSPFNFQLIIDNILHLRLGFSRYLFSRQWTYTVINFLIIIVFFTDTTFRWLRRAQGVKPAQSLSDSDTQAAGPNDPRVEELAAGDLVAGLVLFGLMALVFTYDFIHGTAALTGIGPEGANPIFPNIADVPAGVPLLGGVHLSLIDRLLALVCLPLGFVVLAIAATLSGLSAVRAVYQYPTRTVGGLAGSRDSATAQVALVLYNAITAAVDRYIRLIVFRIVRSLRNVLWIILTFLASLGLALVAKQVQAYLHTSPRPLDVLLFAAFGAAVAVLSVVMAQSLQLFSPRVATNSLLLLGWVGFVLALTFWLFSSTMVGLDWLGQIAGVVPPALSNAPVFGKGSTCPTNPNYHPFLLNLFSPTDAGCNQPFAASYLTFGSAALLVVLLVWLFARQALVGRRK